MKVQEIIKKSGNFGFPIQFLTMLNQLFFKFWEMIYMGLLAYKEMWLSMFFLIVPLPKKNLHNEIAVVRWQLIMNHRHLILIFIHRLLDHLVDSAGKLR